MRDKFRKARYNYPPPCRDGRCGNCERCRKAAREGDDPERQAAEWRRWCQELGRGVDPPDPREYYEGLYEEEPWLDNDDI